MALVRPKTDCPHLEHDLKYTEDIKFKFDTPCKECKDQQENWFCLSCFGIFCSRYVQGHFLKHHEESGHNIGLSFSDLSFWCFACDSYIEHAVNIYENFGKITTYRDLKM